MRGLACGLALSFSCAPAVVSGTPRSVMLEHVTQRTMAEATRKAQAHCAAYDRDAEYVPDAVEDGNATFKCVDRQ